MFQEFGLSPGETAKENQELLSNNTEWHLLDNAEQVEALKEAAGSTREFGLSKVGQWPLPLFLSKVGDDPSPFFFSRE